VNLAPVSSAIRQRLPSRERLLDFWRRARDWPRWKQGTAAVLGLLTLAFFLHELLSPYWFTFRQLSRLLLKAGALYAIWFCAFRWKPNPLTVKKLQRFHAIKRGYYSFLVLAGLLLLTFFGPLIIGNRALLVWYEGRLYFPTYAAYHPGTDFGLDYEHETNYRELQRKFREEQSGNWVLMPIVPFDGRELDFSHGKRNPIPPNAKLRHFLGTDKAGRDVLARLFYGYQIAMLFVLAYIALIYLIGVAIGCAMGFFGGKLDLLGQRLIEIWSSIPFLYMVIISVSLIPTGVEAGVKIAVLLTIMVLFSWTGITFYMRTITYKEKTRDYIAAARVQGASTYRVIFQHLVPNTVSTIVTFLPFLLAGGISSITALDYLGFGLPHGTPSWGDLLRQGTNNMQAPWIVTSAFIAMVLILTLVTFVGEAIRDAYDPKKFTLYR